MVNYIKWAMGALLLSTSMVSQAQSYPAKPIVLINPYAAGGPTDVLARQLAKELEAELKQTIIVENKPGAAAALGTAFVSRANPDGYTLLLGTSAGHVVTPMLQQVAYDGIKDFSFISVITSQPNMLVVSPSLNVNTVADLVAYAKKNPSKLNFGSAGTGGATHLGGELFSQKADAKIVHVPYSGAAPALTDLIGGHVQMAFLNLSACLPYIKDGRIKALAFGSAQRSKLLPEIPTLDESGIHGAEVATWYSLAAPKGTPAAIVQKLNKAISALNTKPEYVSFIQSIGGDLMQLSPDQTTQFVKQDQANMEKLLLSIGLKK